MAPTEMLEEREGACTACFGMDSLNWQKFEGKTYECRVLLCPESDGGYSALALRLPGVVSQGDSIEEALENIREAFSEALSIYLEDQGSIPWEDVDVQRAKGCQERWILVNVQ